MTTTPYLLALLLAQTSEATTSEATDGGNTTDGELVIVSESDCPSSEAVRSALERLRPATGWPAAVVGIRDTDQGISVDVGSRNPVRRQLALGSDCTARASSAALVIATWMNDLPAEVTAAPILRAAPVAVDAVAAPPPVPRTPRYELGAGLGAAVGGGWAPGVLAEILRLPARGTLGGQAGLEVVAPRNLSVGQGSTRWMRASAVVGAHVRHSAERFFLAADLGLAGAVTTAWGTDYDDNSNDRAFAWGPMAGVRAGLPWGRVRLWTGVRGHFWVKGDTVQIDSPSAAWVDQAKLPLWDAQWSLGVGYELP